MAAYAALALLGALTLEGKILAALLVFLGGLALKTIIARAAAKNDD